MNIALIRLFRSAGATGHVFFLKNGKIADRGLAYSGFIGPKTTVAVVPTMPQILDFAIEAQTKDKQEVIVSGNLTTTFIPGVAVTKFDFTVDARNGGYVGNWVPVLNAKVIERVLRAVNSKVRELSVEEATRSQKEVEDAVIAELGQNAFSADGINVASCSIPKIEAAEEDVGQAIGARERQAMLVEADKALHERRLKASANDRAVKKFEAETALKLEGERAKLLEQQGKNKETEAAADAKATEIRMKPLKEVEAGKLLGAALLEGFKTGRVGSINVAPELFAALQQK